jgi:hypothetical protein
MTPAAQREYRAARKREGHDVDRRSHLRSRYNSDPAWYAARLTTQHGVCLACGTAKPSPKSTRFQYFAIHHNHDTNEALFLACLPCNSASGGFHDDPALLLCAAEYLEAEPLPLRSRVPLNWHRREAHVFLSADDRQQLLNTPHLRITVSGKSMMMRGEGRRTRGKRAGDEHQTTHHNNTPSRPPSPR